MDRKELGIRGEEAAASYLRRAGLRIEATNWRTSSGEVDIVAWEGPDLVLVEVKTRRSDRMGTPEEAVSPSKQRRLVRLARAYLASSERDAEARALRRRVDPRHRLRPRAAAAPPQRVLGGGDRLDAGGRRDRHASSASRRCPSRSRPTSATGCRAFSIVGPRRRCGPRGARPRACGHPRLGARVPGRPRHREPRACAAPQARHGLRPAHRRRAARGDAPDTSRVRGGRAPSSDELALDGSVRPGRRHAGARTLGEQARPRAPRVRLRRRRVSQRLDGHDVSRRRRSRALAAGRFALVDTAWARRRTLAHRGRRSRRGRRARRREAGARDRGGGRAQRAARSDRPGRGKTMLARRLGGILPPLTEEERLDNGARPLRRRSRSRPRRSPASGRSARRITQLLRRRTGRRRVASSARARSSLAHNGVLFLDEFAEFSPAALQTLRQPIEDGRLTLVRAEARVALPGALHARRAP